MTSTPKQSKKFEPFQWLSRTFQRAGPYLTLVRSEKDWRKAFEDCGVFPKGDWLKGSGGQVNYLNDKKGEAVCIVSLWLEPDLKPIEVAGLIVHEAVHVVQKYFDVIGETEAGVEQQAYAVQYVSQTLMEEYVRQIEQEKK